jgi:hypothetical protein
MSIATPGDLPAADTSSPDDHMSLKLSRGTLRKFEAPLPEAPVERALAQIKALLRSYFLPSSFNEVAQRVKDTLWGAIKDYLLENEGKGDIIAEEWHRFPPDFERDVYYFFRPIIIDALNRILCGDIPLSEVPEIVQAQCESASNQLRSDFYSWLSDRGGHVQDDTYEVTLLGDRQYPQVHASMRINR